jgi:hypothetical protein
MISISFLLAPEYLMVTDFQRPNSCEVARNGAPQQSTRASTPMRI